MLLQGKVNESIPTKVKDHYLQFVPVKIKYQGNLQGKVKPFFTDSIQKQKDELTCDLRGRPLDGKVTELRDYNVAIVKLPNTLNSKSEESSCCHTVAKCDKMTVWNYDMPHSKGNDVLSRGQLYARLAKVVHSD